MPSTTSYRQGDIILVFFPFTDLTSSKRRPALVISPDFFNAAGEDLILAAITSHITDDPNSIQLTESDFASGRLPKKSIVKTTKLFTMHSSLIVKSARSRERRRKKSFGRCGNSFHERTAISLACISHHAARRSG